jgi:flagellum-specific ATP synthase
MTALLSRLQDAELVRRVGRITRVRGGTLEARGPLVRIGEMCSIARDGGALHAEVVGFGPAGTVLMPYADPAGIEAGAEVVALGKPAQVPAGRALLGRVIDALGNPLDGGGPLAGLARRPLDAEPPAALQRARVTQPLDTGIKAVDAFLSLGKGQRIGLFAGSGVGKSSLLGMLARGAAAQAKVIALIGERSREVREFIDDQLGEEGLRQSVVVVATASAPAVVRWRAAYAATVVAESLRDAGMDVLFMMDSLTRFAMARREVGLAAGEPPTARGYTPSVFSELPRLCERCGNGSAGSITALYTVLVEGDDMNEPVADTARGTLDGHIVLSRELAHAGQFPPIDVLQSVSRLHAALSNADDLAASRTLVDALALYERNRQLVEIGAYKPGSNALLDRTVAAMPAIRAFLSQGLDERVSREAGRVRLRELCAALRGAT